MNQIKYLSAALLSLLAVGCTDYEALKNSLQAEYDRTNQLGQVNRAFCYDVEDLLFPYIAKPIQEDDDGYIRGNKKRLAEKLPLFTDLGLLSRTVVSEDPLLYRYDLTDEGKKYHVFNQIPQGSSSPINQNYFCYGRRVLLKVKEVKERTTTRDGRDYIVATVRYDYQVENVPKWAQSEALAKQYRLTVIRQEGVTYPGSVELRKLDGAYYNTGNVGPTDHR